MFHDRYERINFWSHAVPGAALLLLGALAAAGKCSGWMPNHAGFVVQFMDRWFLWNERNEKPPQNTAVVTDSVHSSVTSALNLRPGLAPGGPSLALFCCCAAATHLCSALTHVYPDSHSLASWLIACRTSHALVGLVASAGKLALAGCALFGCRAEATCLHRWPVYNLLLRRRRRITSALWQPL